MKTSWTSDEFEKIGLSFNYEILEQMKADGLIAFDQNGIVIHESGKPFVRNACMAIDARLNGKRVKRTSI